MNKLIVPVLASLFFLGCGKKEESKEAKMARICDKVHKEEADACAGDKDCLAEASAKLEACKGLAKTIGNTEKGKTMEEQGADVKKKCEAGDQTECATYGAALMLGRGGFEKDEAKGFEVVKKSCESGNGNGCEMLARAYEKGMGVAADTAQFVANMEKACNLGAGGGCRSFALSFETSDPKRIPVLEKACDLKDAIGCMGLGAAYKNGGQGTDADPVKAKKYLQMACDLDPVKMDTACETAKQL